LRHDSSQTAAEALRPIGGEFAFLIFAFGIIGTGLMAVPVLAGSAAYAIGEALRWPVGLAGRPKEARSLTFLPFDPIRALYWSAVINGIMVAPIIVVMMMMMMKLATNRRVMTRFTLSPWLRLVGWSTAVVAAGEQFLAKLVQLLLLVVPEFCQNRSGPPSLIQPQARKS